MDEGSSKKLKRVWNQKEVPVILRRGGKGQKLRLRLPFSSDNHDWLKGGKRHNPEWEPGDKYWEAPKAWFNDLVNRMLNRYGAVYIIQPFREQEICAPACMNASGHECQCSCMGANHGAGNDGSWFEVSEAFAIRTSTPELACRLMRKR